MGEIMILRVLSACAASAASPLISASMVFFLVVLYIVGLYLAVYGIPEQPKRKFTVSPGEIFSDLYGFIFSASAAVFLCQIHG